MNWGGPQAHGIKVIRVWLVGLRNWPTRTAENNSCVFRSWHCLIVTQAHASSCDTRISISWDTSRHASLGHMKTCLLVTRDDMSVCDNIRSCVTRQNWTRKTTTQTCIQYIFPTEHVPFVRHGFPDHWNPLCFKIVLPFLWASGDSSKAIGTLDLWYF